MCIIVSLRTWSGCLVSEHVVTQDYPTTYYKTVTGTICCHHLASDWSMPLMTCLWLAGGDWEMIRWSRDRKWGPILMRCEHMRWSIFSIFLTRRIHHQPHATHDAELSHPNRHHHGNSSGILTNNRIIRIDNCNAGNNIRFWDSSLCLSQNNWVCHSSHFHFLGLLHNQSEQWHWPFGHSHRSFNLTRFSDVKQPL